MAWILLIGLVLLNIGLCIFAEFIGNIIMFDSVVIGIVAAFLSHVFHVHPAFCLLIGIVAFVVMLVLQMTKVGFWFIGGTMTLIWSYAIGSIAYSVSDGDAIWKWVIFGISVVCVGGFHFKAYDKHFSNRVKHIKFKNRSRNDTSNQANIPYESKKDIEKGKQRTSYSDYESNLVRDYRIYDKQKLLTKLEYNFWKVLKEECKDKGILICPKVRMMDLFNVSLSKMENDELRERTEKKYTGFIKSRHIDFVLCDSELHVIAGVELDDSSHDNEDAQSVDRIKDDVFYSARMPLYRIKILTGEENNGNLNDYYKVKISEMFDQIKDGRFDIKN